MKQKDLQSFVYNLVINKLLTPEQGKQVLHQCIGQNLNYVDQYLQQKQWISSAILKEAIAQAHNKYKSQIPSTELNIRDFSSSPKTPSSAKTIELNSSSDGLFLDAKGNFGPYKILGELGRGGMGVVYKAQQLNNNRIVALKVLLKGDARNIQRFFREAQITSKLNHANIVKVHHMGHEQGYHFYTMDYIEGITFGEYLKQKPPTREIVEKLAKIAEALHVAHLNNCVHRDIKPNNILLNKEKEPYITDFGLVKVIDQSTLTDSGQVLGTPFFMAPEQISGQKDLDARVDVYALGVVLYQSITGKCPFEAKTVGALFRVIQKQPVKFPHKLEISPSLKAICLKSLQKNRKNRYKNSKELAEDLLRFIQKNPTKAKMPGVIYKLYHYHSRLLWIAFMLFVAFFVYISFPYIQFSKQKTQKGKVIEVLKKGQDATWHLHYASKLMQRRLYEQAQEGLNKALSLLKSGEIVTRTAINQKNIVVLVGLREYHKALLYQKKHKVTKNKEVLLALGIANFHLTRFSNAKKHFASLLKDSSSLGTHALFYYARVLYEQKAYQKALLCFLDVQKKLGQNTTSYKSKLWFYLGTCTFYLKQASKAIEYLQQARSMDPSFVLAAEYLGRCFLMKDREQEAKSLFEFCLKHHPHSSEYHFLYANVLGKLNQPIKAFKAYKKSLNLNFYKIEAFIGMMRTAGDDVVLREQEKFTISNYLIKLWSILSSFDLFNEEFTSIQKTYRQNYFLWKTFQNKKYQNPKIFLNKIIASGSESVYQSASDGLLALRYQKNILKELQQAHSKNPASQKRIAKIQSLLVKKRKREERLVLYYQMARTYYKDYSYIFSLRKNIKTSKQTLTKILLDKEEQLPLRYLAAKLMLTLHHPKTLAVVKEHALSDDLATAVICNCALKEEGRLAEESPLEEASQKRVPAFIKKIAARNLDLDTGKKYLQKLLQDSDIYVRIYAATRLIIKNNEKARKTLLQGIKHSSPAMRQYSHFYFWRYLPKKIALQQQHVFATGLKDVNRVKNVVLLCAHTEYPSFFTELQKLTFSKNALVNSLAIKALSQWGYYDEVLKAVFNPKYPGFLRLGAVTILLEAQQVSKLWLKLPLLFRDPNPDFRAMIYFYFGMMGIDTLKYLGQEKNETAQANLLATCGYQPLSIMRLVFKNKQRHIHKYLKLVDRFLESKSSNVRKGAAIAKIMLTGNYQSSKLLPLCKNLLQYKNTDIRQGAAIGLYNLLLKNVNILNFYSYSEKMYLWKRAELIHNSPAEKKREYLHRLSLAIELYDNPTYRIERALVFKAARQYSHALKDMDVVFEKSAKYSYYWWTLWEIYLEMKKNKKAHQTAEKIVARFPLKIDDIHRVYLFFQHEKDFKRAKKIEQMYTFVKEPAKPMLGKQLKQIVNVSYGKGIALDHNENICVNLFQGKISQKFFVVLVEKDVYKIIFQKNGKCLEISANKEIRIGAYKNQEYQKWHIKRFGITNSYAIVNKQNGKCLEIIDNFRKSTVLQLGNFQKELNQMWMLVHAHE